MVIPTNREMIRIDHHDAIYKTEDEKFNAVIEEIKDCHERGQPVLVGTVSIEKSERVSNLLKKTGVRHHVLNAKNHEREAEIVAQAGRHGAVTISTNMAGRGTDIVLGGNPEFMAAAEAGTRDLNEPTYAAALAKYREQCAGGTRAGAGRRRLAHPGHRAARIAAHRQPAARPLRAPGRPRLVALLPVAGRRPAANLRRRPAQGLHEQDRHGRRDADRASLDLARDRKRAKEGRGPQLRHPQASARIRRRDEQAARGRLPSPPRAAGRRVAQGRRAGHVRPADRKHRRVRISTPNSDRTNGIGRRWRTPSIASSSSVPNFATTAPRPKTPTT